MNENGKIKTFWAWFSRIAGSLMTDIENSALLEELDTRMHELDPMLSWEIGPGATEPLQLVISPNLNRDLRQKSQEIVSYAPVLAGWEFHSTRRPKNWDYKLIMERSDGRDSLLLDASEWKFVLLRYPNGAQEILLQGQNLSQLDREERWQAAALTLESILGEEILLEKINEFELLDRLELRFAAQEKPIQLLRETIEAA